MRSADLGTAAEGNLRSEKDWRSLLRDGGASLLFLAASKVVALLTSVALARTLGTADMGLYALIVGFVDVASLIASQSVPLAVVKLISEDRSNKRLGAVLGTAAALTTSLLFVVAVVIWFSCGEIASGVYHDEQLDPLLRFSTLLLAVNVARGLAGGLLQGLERIRALNVVHVTAAALQLPMALAFSSKWGVEGALWALGSATVAGSLPIAAFVVVREIRLRGLAMRDLRPQAAILRAISALSVPAFLAAAMSVPQFWLMTALLKRHAGLDAVGVFAVAGTLPRNLGILTAAIALPYIPMVSRLHAEAPGRLPGLIAKTQASAAAALLIPALFLAAFSQTLLHVLYGASYADAWPIMIALAAHAYLSGLNNTIGHVLAGLGRLWSGLAINASTFAVMILFAAVLIPAHGAAGAGLSYVVAMLWHTTIVRIFAVRVLKIPSKGFWKLVAGPAVLFAAITIMLFAVRNPVAATSGAAATALLGSLWAARSLLRANAPQKEILC